LVGSKIVNYILWILFCKRALLWRGLFAKIPTGSQVFFANEPSFWGTCWQKRLLLPRAIVLRGLFAKKDLELHWAYQSLPLCVQGADKMKHRVSLKGRMDIYIHIYICICIYIHIYVYIYTCILKIKWNIVNHNAKQIKLNIVYHWCALMYTRTYTYIYIYTYLYVYVHIYMHMYIYIYMYIYMYLHIHKKYK